MRDAMTGQLIRVSAESASGPYISLSAHEVERVRSILEANNIPFWVDHRFVSVDGKPALAVINLGRKTDPDQVQAILDAAV